LIPLSGGATIVIVGGLRVKRMEVIKTVKGIKDWNPIRERTKG
jgi:hypothetical protein